MSIEQILLGGGAGLLGVLVTFGLPVSPRRVNQGLVTLLAVVLLSVAALTLLGWPTGLIAAVIASIIAILYRDVARFVKHAYYGVTKYSRRDYWYRRVGEAILGGRSRRR